jgi:hypothetical protein
LVDNSPPIGNIDFSKWTNENHSENEIIFKKKTFYSTNHIQKLMTWFWWLVLLLLTPIAIFFCLMMYTVIIEIIFHLKRNNLLKKNPKLKSIPTLPFNYGIGQFIEYIDRKNFFNYIKNFAINKPEPLLAYFFLYFEGILVRDPQVIIY